MKIYPTSWDAVSPTGRQLHIQAADLPRLASSGQVIKESPARKVCEVTVSGQPCILKVFFTPTWLDRWRHCCAPSKARLEWQAAHTLEQLGIPTITPLALFEERRGLALTSYLLVRKIPRTYSLRDLTLGQSGLNFAGPTHAAVQTFPRERLPSNQDLVPRPAPTHATAQTSPPRLDPTARHRLARQLGAMTAKLHLAGVWHRDFHAGNWLVDEQGQLYLIDLHSMRFCRRALGRRRRHLNLAALANFFLQQVPRSERLRFLEAYRQAWPPPRPTLSQLTRQLQVALDHFLMRFYRQRDRRCLRANKYFRPLRTSAGRGFYCAAQQHLPALLQHPESLLKQGQYLKDSASSTISRTPWGILKRFNLKKSINLFFDTLRGSRARRSWVAAYRCQVRGIPTARAWAFLDQVWGPFPHTSYLLMAEIPGQGLDHFLHAQQQSRAPSDFRQLKKRLMRRLGRLLRQLHAAHLSHRDLKAANFLIVPHGQGEQIYLIDLDSLKYAPPLPRQHCLNDLRRLCWALSRIRALTRTDRLRLLHAYLPFANTRELHWWWPRCSDYRRYAKRRQRLRPS